MRIVIEIFAVSIALIVGLVWGSERSLRDPGDPIKDMKVVKSIILKSLAWQRQRFITDGVMSNLDDNDDWQADLERFDKVIEDVKEIL